MMKHSQAGKSIGGKTSERRVADAGASQKAPFCNHNVLEHLKSTAEERYYAQDSAMLAVTDAILRSIQAAGLKQAELAKRIGKSSSHVSQVLSGRRNMTLTTIADMLWACQQELSDLVVSPIGQSEVSRDRMDVLLETAFRPVANATDAAALSAQTQKPFRLVVPSMAVAKGELVGA